MKTTGKIAIAIAAVLMIAATVIPISHSCDGENRGIYHGPGKFMQGMQMFHELDLTDLQKNEIAAIVTEYRKDLQSMVDRAVEDRDAIRELFHAEVFDEAAAREQIREMQRKNEDLIITFGKMLRDIRPVLTAEQIEKIEAFHGEGPGMKMHGHINHIRKVIDHILDEWSK